MNNEQVTVSAEFWAKAGCENALRDELLAIVGPTRKEDGCINYDLHEAGDEAGHFLFYENWTNRELLDKHLKSEHICRYREKTAGLIEEKKVQIWKMI